MRDRECLPILCGFCMMVSVSQGNLHHKRYVYFPGLRQITNHHPCSLRWKKEMLLVRVVCFYVFHIRPVKFCFVDVVVEQTGGSL